MMIVMCLVAMCPTTSPAANAADWSLNAAPAVSNDGVFRLTWDAPVDTVTLQQSSRADFGDARTVYRGTDRATVISGQRDGAYHFRLLDVAGEPAARVDVTVAHHPLARAWAFFAVGLGVFVATIALVARGTGRDDA